MNSYFIVYILIALASEKSNSCFRKYYEEEVVIKKKRFLYGSCYYIGRKCQVGTSPHG
jgi:hypothetical protein